MIFGGLLSIWIYSLGPVSIVKTKFLDYLLSCRFPRFININTKRNNAIGPVVVLVPSFLFYTTLFSIFVLFSPAAGPILVKEDCTRKTEEEHEQYGSSSAPTIPILHNDSEPRPPIPTAPPPSSQPIIPSSSRSFSMPTPTIQVRNNRNKINNRLLLIANKSKTTAYKAEQP